MHFYRIGSVIICPTAKSLVFLTKCMYLWLGSCRVQWYLPLSAALGDFCVALQKGVVSQRLYTLPSKADSQPDCLLISRCEIPERAGGSIKIINKEVRISPYFWCGSRHCDRKRPFAGTKCLVELQEFLRENCIWFYNRAHVCRTAKTVFSVIPVALFTLVTVCACMRMCVSNSCWSLVGGVCRSGAHCQIISLSRLASTLTASNP